LQHPTVQVIGRNEEYFPEDARRLVIEPPACSLELCIRQAHILTFNYRSYRLFKDSEAESVSFGIGGEFSQDEDVLPSGRYQQVLLFMPKSKPELELYLDIAASFVEEDGCVFLVGEKKAGIASGAKRLAQRAEKSEKLDSAKHCQLWEATGFEARVTFDINTYIEALSIRINETELKLAAIPGVFASGKLDEGTRLLLEQRVKRLKGRTLDFGCGSGVIGAYLKCINPEIQLESIDINWLALLATKKTLELNSLEGKVYPSDGWSEVQGRVNGVVTNPPFHQGVSTEYETTESFVRTAYSKMARYAPMYIVANNFLRYPTLIESVFGKCTYYAKNTKFNVYYCER
jgi:16S rRNA (guanine1207-N2)-methyltransferase